MPMERICKQSDSDLWLILFLREFSLLSASWKKLNLSFVIYIYFYNSEHFHTNVYISYALVK